MNTVESILKSEADLETLVPLWLEQTGEKRKIALYGDLGAGKTTLVQAFCRHLGVRETVASPTFGLIHQYRYTEADNQEALVHHLDLYRLKSVAEAVDLGIEDLLYDPWYCFIEWPQLIEPLFPPDIIKIQLEMVNNTGRRVLIL